MGKLLLLDEVTLVRIERNVGRQVHLSCLEHVPYLTVIMMTNHTSSHFWGGSYARATKV